MMVLCSYLRLPGAYPGEINLTLFNEMLQFQFVAAYCWYPG